jgi:hypothetical protein
MKALTAEQTAAILGFDVKTVQRLAREQKIPANKALGKWWIDKEKLEAMLLGVDNNAALQAVGTDTKEEKTTCQSKSATNRACGGSISTHRTENEYAKVVELPIKNKRKNTMTS